MKKMMISLIAIAFLFVLGSNPVMAQTAIAGAGASSDATALGVQGQDQGQQQGQSNFLNFNPVSNSTGSVIPRNMPIPADIMYPPLPTMFAQPLKGAYAVDWQEILIYKVTYTQSQLVAMSKGLTESWGGMNKPTVITKNIRTYPLEDVVVYPADKEREVTFLLEKPAVGKKCWMFGFSIVQQETDKGDSVANLGLLGLEAIALGANTVHLTAQGAAREYDAKGIGIGLSYTYAQMDLQGEHGSVGAGGTGFSWGWAKYLDRPWTRGITLYMEDGNQVKK